jgi:SAM-dependent methyltransferase
LSPSLRSEPADHGERSQDHRILIDKTTEMALVTGQSRGLACKICGNELGNESHDARETMFGWHESFRYVECGLCGVVSLASPPADLGRFYPRDYASLGPIDRGLRGVAKKLRVQAYFGRGLGFGSWIARRYPRPDLAAMAKMKIPKNCRILDVGCGSGKLLLELSGLGYKNLAGTDPFIGSDLDYGNRVRVKKSFLIDLAAATTAKPVWDLITFHHSFEHVPDQLETLQAAARLLAPNGRCVIRIPVIGYAWEKYRTNWVQLDPPRHFFLHTEKSMELLTRKAGLNIKSVEYDSNEFQFWGSELCRRRIALRSYGVPHRFFSTKQLREFKSKAEELNAARRGDQAVFHLTIAA